MSSNPQILKSSNRSNSDLFSYWAHFNGQRRRLREHAGPRARGVEVWYRNDDEPADVLLGFCERTVGDQQVDTVRAHDGRRARWMQTAGEDPRPGGLHLLVNAADILHDFLERGCGRRVAVGLVNAEQELRHLLRILLVAGYWLLVTGYWLLAPAFRQPKAVSGSHQPPATSHQRPAT